jgi:hypothetical protein
MNPLSLAHQEAEQATREFQQAAMDLLEKAQRAEEALAHLQAVLVIERAKPEE